MTAGPITFQVFAKAPRAGAVKTRLAPALSPVDAARLYVRLLERTIAALEGARRALPESILQLWCWPDIEHPTLAALATHHGLELRLQQGADLGARMECALREAMPGLAVLVGSDCPSLDVSLLLRAVEALLAADAVFAPTEDGGYALVGCRRRVPDCFSGVGWSTPDVMRATRERLAASATRWIELPSTWDVDEPRDLARVAADAHLSPLLEGLTLNAPGGRRHRHTCNL
jgi:rSAM/selenodomain-associated transferase 1